MRYSFRGLGLFRGIVEDFKIEESLHFYKIKIELNGYLSKSITYCLEELSCLDRIRRKMNDGHHRSCHRRCVVY